MYDPVLMIEVRVPSGLLIARLERDVHIHSAILECLEVDTEVGEQIHTRKQTVKLTK